MTTPHERVAQNTQGNVRSTQIPGPDSASVASPHAKAIDESLSCWDQACLRLEKVKDGKRKINVLQSGGQRWLSESGETCLNKDKFLQRLRSGADRQNEKSGLNVLLGRLWETIRPFKTIAQVGARADPHQVAPYVVGGVFLISEELSRGLEYHNLIIEVFTEIAGMVSRWYYFDTRLLDLGDPGLDNIRAQTQNIRNDITELFYRALELIVSVYSYTGKQKMKKMKNLGRRGSGLKIPWESDLKWVRAVESRCDVSRNLIDLESAFQPKETEILDWIAEGNQQGQHRGLRERMGVDDAYKNCGKWFFDSRRYCAWKDLQDESEPILWLKGTLGTGKTMLMCMAIDHLLNDPWFEPSNVPEHRVIYHYCTRNESGDADSDTLHCLRALARQLAIQPRDRSIALAVRKEWNGRKANHLQDRDLTLEDCQRLLEKLIGDSRIFRVTIVVDALDECHGNGDRLLKRLQDLLKSRPKAVRLLLSSQEHVRHSALLPEEQKGPIYLRERVTKADMKTFIETEIKKKLKTQSCYRNHETGILVTNQGLRDKVKRTLLESAKGMFLWAKLYIEIIFPDTPLESEKKVEDILDRLKNENPKDLTKAYERLYQNESNENERRNTTRTYRLLLNSFEPLTVTAVAEAVSIKDNGKVIPSISEAYIRRRCQNFFVENEHGVLQIAHESARKFLREKQSTRERSAGREGHAGGSSVVGQTFSNKASHREIAKICLELIGNATHDFWQQKPSSNNGVQRYFVETITNASKLGSSPDTSNISRARGCTSFADYVIFFWAEHCRWLSSGSALGSTLSAKLTKILCNSENTALPQWWKGFHPYSTSPTYSLQSRLRRLGNMKLYDCIPDTWVQALDTHYARLIEKVKAANRFRGQTPESLTPYPQPFLALCTWDFAECLSQPGFDEFLDVGNWPLQPHSPIFICCRFGANNTLDQLIHRFPEKVWTAISEDSSRGVSCLSCAVQMRHVKMAESLLKFEWSRFESQACWTSQQLSSLSSLDNLGIRYSRGYLPAVKMLLKFEASQVGANFPLRKDERWTSQLVQRPSKSRSFPLHSAIKTGSVEMVELFLDAGAGIPWDRGASSRNDLRSHPLTGAKTYANMSPLMTVLLRKDWWAEEMLNLLLRRFPNILAQESRLRLVEVLGKESDLKLFTILVCHKPEIKHWTGTEGKTAQELVSAHFNLQEPYPWDLEGYAYDYYKDDYLVDHFDDYYAWDDYQCYEETLSTHSAPTLLNPSGSNGSTPRSMRSLPMTHSLAHRKGFISSMSPTSSGSLEYDSTPNYSPRSDDSYARSFRRSRARSSSFEMEFYGGEVESRMSERSRSNASSCVSDSVASSVSTSLSPRSDCSATARPMQRRPARAAPSHLSPRVRENSGSNSSSPRGASSCRGGYGRGANRASGVRGNGRGDGPSAAGSRK